MYIYLNSDYVKAEEAKISPFDHGYLYGLGAFETFRLYKGHPFLLDDHLHRLQGALEELHIRLELTGLKIEDVIQKLLVLNQLENENVSVRLNVSAGAGGLAFGAMEYWEPTVMLFMRKLPEMPENLEKSGRILSLPRNTPEGEQRLKSHHYLNNILAKHEIGNDPSIEGIFLTKEGFVAEGIVSNLFWIKDHIVYTPSIDTGILNGITRQFIMRCLEKIGLQAEEGFYPAEKLLKADEVFAVNSVQEIIPLKEIGSQSFLGKKGEITQTLQKMYKQNTMLLKSRFEL
ncbi:MULTISPECIES: aminodeoxychorismate lyase [Metabacillus]|uniref:Aminodeoxychorismate lyase n=1 Tax=Metabacillus hrfriensis TaxID=3048891 RepID=A0ACD4RBV8_9BACI|nr:MULTISPECIES: aminodeoxychorismate lyase [Metabacillus]UAL52403.1 aminodeoxychorismate lyase [Metabacillus dongyingensis]USK28713.1 aminodeoxychorismate lyase [Bacillus sp. CMF21]WHZ57931.1 aminodeoxychorismate lyase [Metabacillus sp. CT-WN-B3]